MRMACGSKDVHPSYGTSGFFSPTGQGLEAGYKCGGLIGKASISMVCNSGHHFLCGGKLQLPSHLIT